MYQKRCAHQTGSALVPCVWHCAMRDCWCAGMKTSSLLFTYACSLIKQLHISHVIAHVNDILIFLKRGSTTTEKRILYLLIHCGGVNFSLKTDLIW